ncbi:hypothetical protein MY04_06025 (plasmid) [Flammeovirga sp. MY04]|uniref:hypothetical protein n=1 Tax=Flammeovirga sp. MY04 TaxID=1191459 RepID=UPI0008062E43|nr:hypothetical protein [Flammeovirga sp. MY04]ANQ52937.1 hypothetical protein MY04_06025 [Flammeovirga sp. MY04]
MKNSIFYLFNLLLLISFPLLADDEDEKNKNISYNEVNAPEIKTDPFSEGLINETSLDLFIQGERIMLIDIETDNVLFHSLKEGKDFVRVYTDVTDGNKVLLIWEIKGDDKTGNIKWKIFSYKKFPSTGWRPVNNNTTKVLSFK